MNALQGLENPFKDQIVPSPWETCIDVDSIHRMAFDACMGAIEEVRQKHRSTGVLIQGAAGSGKTHLLARLRRCLQPQQEAVELNSPQQAFVWIRLDTNPRWMWRHVRHKLVEALLKRLPNDLTQLEHLLAHRMATMVEGSGDLAQWWEYMREARPETLNDCLYELAEETGASANLLVVLESLIMRRQRLTCRSWLMGDPLSEAKLLTLNVSPTIHDDHESLEQESARIVMSLCRLASPTMAIALCFDQIEALQVNLDDSNGLAEFGKLVRELHDQTQHVAIITCIQSEYFAMHLDRVPKYAQAAFQSYGSFPLLPLTMEEAEALVALRLRSSEPLQGARPAQADCFWPFSQASIRQIVQESLDWSPRKLIEKFQSRFDILQGKNQPNVRTDGLLTAWEKTRETAVRENKPEHTEQILADGLPLLLQIAVPEWKVSAPTDRDLEFMLRAPQGEANVGVSLCTNENMTSLAGRLNRLRDRMTQTDLHKLVLLRDKRSGISTGAKKTQEHLSKLLADGNGVFIRPDSEVLAALDALRKLFADAQSGDLTVDGQSINVKTLREWMINHLADPLREFTEQLTGYQGIAPWDETDELEERLLELLHQHHLLELPDAAEQLNCSAESLTAIVERSTGGIGWIAGERGVLFEMVSA